MKIGDVIKTKYYSIYRERGLVSFAVSGVIDRLWLRRFVDGDTDSDLINFESVAFFVQEHNMPRVEQDGFLELESLYTIRSGVFRLIVNEHIVSENEKAQSVLENIIKKVTAELDKESGVADFLCNYDGEE